MAGPDNPPPPPGPGRTTRPPHDNLLKVATAAARLDASPKTVYRLCYAGKLTPVPIGCGKLRPRIRIRESELNKLIEEGVR